MSDLAIRVENLSKMYRIGTADPLPANAWQAMRSVAASPFRYLQKMRRPPSEEETFWALRDVSFEVKQGEVVGIIGRNGAGKSTLLKILSRITEPTAGRADIYGRVGSLLEVGTGFHPELTGRENIFLNGAILGMKRGEIQHKFDEIVAFAEIEQFLDTPVKRYSSGMYVRLAFAVAAHLEPEILLVDEVLAVGDASFQKKALGKMGDVVHEGRTVLFVSHNMGAINRLCPYSLWMDSGGISFVGSSAEVTSRYLTSSYVKASRQDLPIRSGAHGQIISVTLLNSVGLPTTDFASGEEPVVQISFRLNFATKGLHVACIVNSSDGYHLFSTADTDSEPSLFSTRQPGDYVTQVQLPTKLLNVGTYNIAVGLGVPGVQSLDRQDVLSFTIHDTGDIGSMKEGGRRSGLLLAEVPWRYL